MLNREEQVGSDTQTDLRGDTRPRIPARLASTLRSFGRSMYSGVSVIICGYTEARFDELLGAVDSVRRQTIPALEIIVVVDYNPRLLARLRTCLPDVTLIENAYNQGLSGARNTGLAAAQGELIAFLDDDAEADSQWLEQLVAGFANPQVLGVGGFIQPIWDGGRPAWFPDEFLWVVGCSYRGLPETPAPVRNLIGCNMAFRREACLELSGFNSHFGHIGERPYGDEETEFCIRMRQRWPECVLLYIPQARVRHHVPATRVRWRYFHERCSLEGASKATLATVVGAQDGLATERTYTQYVLPMGILRGCADLVLRRDPAGIIRAYVILAGLMSTAVAYAKARMAHRVYLSSVKPAATRTCADRPNIT